MNTARLPVIALTSGEPAGIGPELAIMLAASHPGCVLVVLGDPDLLTERARAIGKALSVSNWDGKRPSVPGTYLIPIHSNIPSIAGQLDRRNAGYVIRMLERAVDGCLTDEFDAMVTAPVQKSVINDAGIPFTGHTEFLAERAGCPLPVMMLATNALRVALATTHLPLTDVSRHITHKLLITILQTLQRDLTRRFGISSPRILVCGLNPHAGEGGHLGREEIDVIEPAIKECAAGGMHVLGPVPADTAFTPARLRECDAVLAMYHDQGLPVIKHHDFTGAVNITLGLPFVRTSVDHGTALDLAGSGRADPSSLHAALDMALSMIHS